jgi:hypothetical protein
MLRRNVLGGLLVAFGIAAAIPSLAQAPADPKPIPVEAKWTIETTESGRTGKITVTLTGTSIYDGKPIYMLSNGARTALIDVATLNNVGAMREGKMVWTALPNDGMFSWPLSIGKTWSGSFNYTDYEKGANFTGVGSYYRVTGYEDVTVPAGTFKAYRVEGTPGANESVTRTAWYAPMPGIVVKRISVREGGMDYRGTSSRSIMELVEYPQR